LTYSPRDRNFSNCWGDTSRFSRFKALTNPGDEVLVPDSSFVCYQSNVLIADGKPVSTPVLDGNMFELNADFVMSHITARSRLIIVNFPKNPTGAVFCYDDLRSLSKLAIERDLIVISDEVYERITYDEAKHYCLASFPRIRERALVVGSFSRIYAMTGFRIGYVLGPEELITPMMLIH